MNNSLLFSERGKNHYLECAVRNDLLLGSRRVDMSHWGGRHLVPGIFGVRKQAKAVAIGGA